MPPFPEPEPVSRRTFVRTTSALAASTLAGGLVSRPDEAVAAPKKVVPASHPQRFSRRCFRERSAGFDPKTGQPGKWPLRYSMISWSTTLRDLAPGTYEFRARIVDLNNFAQPEPRPVLKTGKNAVEVHRFEVTP